MKISKIFDCITFFDNNFMFELRYNILFKHVDYFVVYESKYDHSGKIKKKNFKFLDYYDKQKIIYFFDEQPFPKNTNRWQNQAIQREKLLDSLQLANLDDYIFFSDPDEIMRPELLNDFKLDKKFGIFMQTCFVYKLNLFNSFESPWEGSRVAKKKDINSIDFMRQKILSKNLNYPFYRIDKEKRIQLFQNGGWHFNNIMSPKEISLKLKTFAHTEYSSEEYSNEKIIEEKIKKKVDLFNRGFSYNQIKLDNTFPKYILENNEKYSKWIL
jgi:beta-1,4-mannosyl-glycoprotein beta-1,4-N-acetylglucosaminyltransferase